MSSPQKENGFTPIANELLEKIISSGLNGTELSVIFHVLRKTYGYQKKEDEISLSQFILAIPSSKQTIVTALNNLQLVRILRLVKKGTSKNSSNIWCFNKNYDEWQLVRKARLVKKIKPTSPVLHTQLVKKTRHTKENTKENTKESIVESSSTESFSFKEYMNRLKSDKDNRFHIIACYWEFKGIEYDNLALTRSEVKRNLKPASALKFTPLEKIQEIMFAFNGAEWMDWTLETVIKYVGRDLTKLNK